MKIVWKGVDLGITVDVATNNVPRVRTSGVADTASALEDARYPTMELTVSITAAKTATRKSAMRKLDGVKTVRRENMTTTVQVLAAPTATEAVTEKLVNVRTV